MAIIVQLDGGCRVLVFRHTLSRKEALLKSKPFCLLLVLGAMYLNPQARASELQQPQDITISASPVTLAARLYLPAGSGPFPALIFTQRGYGQSTGDWKRSTFDDLATDAIAAVRYIKTRPEIVAHRIGLRGASAGLKSPPASRVLTTGFTFRTAITTCAARKRRRSMAAHHWSRAISK